MLIASGGALGSAASLAIASPAHAMGGHGFVPERSWLSMGSCWRHVLVLDRSCDVPAALACTGQHAVSVPLLDGDVTLRDVLMLAPSYSGVVLAVLASTFRRIGCIPLLRGGVPLRGCARADSLARRAGCSRWRCSTRRLRASARRRRDITRRARAGSLALGRRACRSRLNRCAGCSSSRALREHLRHPSGSHVRVSCRRA